MLSGLFKHHAGLEEVAVDGYLEYAVHQAGEVFCDGEAETGTLGVPGFVAALKSTPGLTLDDIVKLSPLDVFELSEVCADNYFFR